MRRYRLATYAVLAAPPDSPAASGGGASNGSFCRQFTKTHADLVAAAENGNLSASNAEAEILQTINAAPSDVQKSATEILNVQYDILAKNPQGPQERQNPAYIQAEQAYLAWSKTNC